MKSIMSINNKFFLYSPKELYEIVKDYNIDGFEIYIDFSNENEIKYLKDLAYLCYSKNMLFQVHGNSSLSIDEQLKFFSYLEDIYNLLGYKINVVLHPLSLDSKEESIEATINYFSELTRLCNNDKITISLENLNGIINNERLNKNEITPIVANNEDIYMTFDLGHEISEYGKITDLNEYIVPLITNVHIHTMNTNFLVGFDHKPIYKNDPYWNELLKGILYLKKYKYDGPIVFEYDLYACAGENTKEKLISYAKSIEWMNDYLNKS